ncbi:peroxisomal membrane protein 11B [Centruroides vittatus]|uniref:peroxisomal membrane protein 11B n=3 Tax=Centruroides TaxID=6875 RepID=UPI00350F3546
MPANMMDVILRFNTQTVGRDRLFRFLQYGSRLVWWLLEKYSHDKDKVSKLKNLEYSLSTARKLFHLGRSLDSIYGALNTINLPDLTLRLTLTLSRINMALYLLADNMLWIGRVGLAKINKAKWSEISYKLWLYALIMNLIRDAYEIFQLIQIHTSRCSTYPYLPNYMEFKDQLPSDMLYNRLRTILQWMIVHKDVTLDTIRNGCDFWIPFSSLGYVNLSPGLVGFLGVVSSLLGMIPIVDASYKLVPS